MGWYAVMWYAVNDVFSKWCDVINEWYCVMCAMCKCMMWCDMVSF